MKKLLIALLLCCECLGMESRPVSPVLGSGRSTPTTRGLSPSRSSVVLPPLATHTETYIPQHTDMTEALHRESICCFYVSRWILQPINVITPLISSGFVATGEYFVHSNPGLAMTLNGVGLGFSIAGFVTSVLLLKVNNKLEKIDQYIGERHRS